jgi:predicted nuclease of predicted toxin-antitoxin system
MKILAAENISKLLVERLRQEGHQVQYIAEIARGCNDPTVLELANRQGALLLTDDKDFGELVFHQHQRI